MSDAQSNQNEAVNSPRFKLALPTTLEDRGIRTIKVHPSAFSTARSENQSRSSGSIASTASTVSDGRSSNQDKFPGSSMLAPELQTRRRSLLNTQDSLRISVHRRSSGNQLGPSEEVARMLGLPESRQRSSSKQCRIM